MSKGFLISVHLLTRSASQCSTRSEERWLVEMSSVDGRRSSINIGWSQPEESFTHVVLSSMKKNKLWNRSVRPSEKVVLVHVGVSFDSVRSSNVLLLVRKRTDTDEMRTRAASPPPAARKESVIHGPFTPPSPRGSRGVFQLNPVVFNIPNTQLG